MEDNSKQLYTAFIANLDLFEKLSETRPQLRELLDDHSRLLKAIAYWGGRSEVKVAEFFHLALELEEEIMEFTSVYPTAPGRPGRQS